MSKFISEVVRRSVAAAFADCCAYCRSAQEYSPETLQIEHIQPRSRGGADDESNLCFSCGTCNRHKAARTIVIDAKTNRRIALFNPRIQAWTDHFRWSRSGLEIVGITLCGRATVDALQMNSKLWLTVRSNWVAAGWHPPPESRFSKARENA